MKILVTGFDPFGGETVNPAYEAVKLLPNEIKSVEVIKLEIPTVFEKGANKVIEAIEIHKPDFVLNIGQAGGRGSISVEKIGINLKEARIPDNEGNQPFESPIKTDGETAYFATLPVKAMVENVRKNGIPSNLSFSAGTYVCNDVLYSVLYEVNKKYPHIKAGFIHVPFATVQVVGKPDQTPSMPIETIAKGLEYAIEAIVENSSDINLAMGETH